MMKRSAFEFSPAKGPASRLLSLQARLHNCLRLKQRNQSNQVQQHVAATSSLFSPSATAFTFRLLLVFILLLLLTGRYINAAFSLPL